MNSVGIFEFLKKIGWQEDYLHKPLKKYYRLRVSTPQGWEYVYVNRSDPDAMLCLHPRFFEWRNIFRNLPGVDIGGAQGKLMMQSADLLEFPVGKGRTGDDIPEYFPLRFMTDRGLRNAVVEIFRLIGLGDIGEEVHKVGQEPTVPILMESTGAG